MKRGTGQGDIILHTILNFSIYMYGLQMNRIQLLQNILIYSYAQRYDTHTIAMYIDIHIDKRMCLSPCICMHDNRHLR